VPVPYPIIVSLAADLVKGSKTVKIDGGNMVAIKGSEFSRCTGDEPGTAGGVVSNVNMREASWILYSFDVKVEGKNACRLSDKMLMNHGNTACLAGHVTKPVGLSPDDDLLADECMEQHDKYKATQAAQAQVVTPAYNDLHDKVYANNATQAEREAFAAMVHRRYELCDRLTQERLKYIEMDCDKFAWVVNGTPNSKTPAQRKTDHEGEVYNVMESMKNFEKDINKAFSNW
jgi:hypothetical protein